MRRAACRLAAGALLSASAPLAAAEQCQRIGEAEAWLLARAPAWSGVLAGSPGFEPPVAVTVCRTSARRPFADYAARRIWLRRISPEEDRLTLAHEWLHLAFRHHPAGRDERFIEERARALVLEQTAAP